MAAINRFILLVRDLRREQSGMAVATALVAMTIAFTFASAAVVYSVNTQHGTVRDHDSKEAIAAADAGANVALMRLNQFSTAVSSSSPCVGLNGGYLVPTKAEADGWCPQLTGTVGGATYSYRVGPSETTCGEYTSCVVAVGTSNGVSQRVEVTLESSPVGGPFSKAGVIGQEDITLDQHSNIRVGVGTNGNVTLTNNSTICGDIRHGVGKKISIEAPASQCSGYVQTEGNEALPPVTSFMPEDIATHNSDARLVKCTSIVGETRTPAECQLDSYSKKKWETTVPWNATTRTIEPAQNSTLTLTGGDYFICRLILGNNSHLIMGDPASVRIFFDTPENCGIRAGEAQIRVEGNADITASSYQEKHNVIGLYLIGSTTIPTTVLLKNNAGSTNEFVLYAPNSDIYMENKSFYKGAIAGKTVHLSNHASVEQDPGFKPPTFGGSILYSRQSYVECTGATASPPNANC
jgi:hypothetical protein